MKKRPWMFFPSLCVLFCVFFLCSGRASAAEYGHDNDGNALYAYNIEAHAYCDANGTQTALAEGDGMEIGTPEELVWFADYVSNGGVTSGITWILTGDLSMDGESLSIGTPEFPFEGTFDGGGYTISGYTFSLFADNVGLFRCISGASIENLTIDQSSLSLAVVSHCNIGGLAGLAENSTISGCTNRGDVEAYSLLGSFDHVGGLIGSARNCVISSCVNYGKVSSSSEVGGLVGTLEGGRLDWSVNHGEIAGDTVVGGLAGMVIGLTEGGKAEIGIAKLQYCSTDGAVSADRTGTAGGLMGACGEINTSTYDCYNLGEVSGGTAGGLSGENGYFTCCYNAGSVSGRTAGHPLAPNLTDSSFLYCFYDSDQMPGDYSADNCRGATTAQLQSGRVFDTAAGADAFGQYWCYEEGHYPSLDPDALEDQAGGSTVPSGGGGDSSAQQSAGSIDFFGSDIFPYDGQKITVGTDLSNDIQYAWSGAAAAVEFSFLDGVGTAMEAGQAPENAGSYTLRLTMGSVSKDFAFSIQRHEISLSDFLNTDSFSQPELFAAGDVVKKVALSDENSFLSNQYTVSYANNGAPTPAGANATLTITGTGNCAGKLTFTFPIAVDADTPFAPTTSGSYTVGETGSELVYGDDPTVYAGGSSVYLESGKTYAFETLAESEARK